MSTRISSICLPLALCVALCVGKPNCIERRAKKKHSKKLVVRVFLVVLKMLLLKIPNILIGYIFHHLPYVNSLIQLFCLLLITTDSTNPECFTVPMAVLVEMCYGNNKATTQLPGPSNTLAAAPTVPCPMSLLDSLTVHAKMRSVSPWFYS